jgi:hypothetical protein
MNPSKKNKSTIQIEDLGRFSELSDLEVEKIVGGAVGGATGASPSFDTSGTINTIKAAAQAQQEVAAANAAASVIAMEANAINSTAGRVSQAGKMQ